MTSAHLWTLTQTRAALGGGHICAAEYFGELVARRSRLGNLNAFVSGTGPASPGPSHPGGPLCGIPLAVNDNIDVAGLPTTACTPALAHHVPRRDSGVWQLCARAGAVVMGKTTMHELAYGVTGAHAGRFTARNPTDSGRLAGGSSSGTAAAVAAGIVPAGLGTDTGGSARIPAAHCGVVGFRPSTGRYPGRGTVQISTTRDTVGVLARSVDDVCVLDAVLSGEAHAGADLEPPEPPVVVVPRAIAWSGLDPEVARVAEAALDTLRSAGWQLRDLAEPCTTPLYCSRPPPLYRWPKPTRRCTPI
ncbi:amidase family protein [Streptomyces longwoodensis]|uniref:amidase family protein n=1 Tax=Streptomyces longwoodensis TaxID=68231 RepID=UPI0034049AA9